jgi:putative transposase
MTLFHNKYRIESSRLNSWDYTTAAPYFITICTSKRLHYFGKIEDGKLIYTPVGAITDILWHEIKNHVPNIELDKFVVMPNHVHGILILGNIVDRVDVVETLHATSLPSSQPIPSQSTSPLSTTPPTMATISPKPHSVSAIIRSYKSAVTKHAHRLGFEFEWQSRFHDHIIRDQQSFERIQDYIINNPVKWDADKLYTR